MPRQKEIGRTCRKEERSEEVVVLEETKRDE